MDDAPLPPWKKYPEIPRYSIGWRMGDGEAHLVAWWEWAEGRSADTLLAYFRAQMPIAPAWADWVGFQLGGGTPNDEEHLLESAARHAAALGLVEFEAWERAVADEE